MTLCGLLQHILLVVASVVIWGTVITGLQIFGYGIALSGLVYYGIGYEGIQACWESTQKFTLKILEGKPKDVNGPTSLRKVVITCIFLAVIFLLMGGVALGNDQAAAFLQDLKKGLFDLDS